jgi:1-deoxy-D-xylulose-5-phosphate synthase
VTLLETVHGPEDLKRLSPGQLPVLAAELRDFMVDTVSRTGGHLGPSLGVVEIAIALHRVFDSPRDKVLWDTGHQSYPHKILTGRREQFDTLRKKGGLSGYPSRAESSHDVIENSHASTALSYADGLSKAYRLRGEDRHVVAVVGDGALTGGMCWEALNNIAAGHLPVVVVVNDNGRSYSPTIGGLAEHLATLRMTPQYEQALDVVRGVLNSTPLVGPPLYEALHGMKRGLKDFLQPQVLFEDLGLKYVGPIDGHDEQAMEAALRRAKEFGGPVIVHAVTVKGYGYQPAVDDEADCLHSVGIIDPVTGKPVSASAKGWTSVFSDEMVAIGGERPDVVAITAAMLQPVGLHAFSERFPERTFDVGIAEQHAVTSAAGLAMGGMHPVVALYATFLNRAFDQALLDVALHGLPVTFVLDRAGITGEDGASHNGMWDMSLLQIVPGLRLAAPATAGSCASSSARRWPSRTGRPPSASPRAPWARTSPRSTGWAASTCCAARRATTCCSWPSARWAGWPSRSPSGPAPRASASPSSTRAGWRRCRPSSSSWPAATGSSSPWRTTGAPAGWGQPSRRPCATPTSTSRPATSASRGASSTTAAGSRSRPTSG